MVLRNILRHILADRTAAGAMELGLALPFLMLLGLGTVDASMLIGTKLDLEQAAQRTTDFALAKRPNGSNGSYLQAEAASAANVSEQDVTVSIWLECNGLKQNDFNALCPSGETPARFVNVNITSDVETEFDWGSLASIVGVQTFGAKVPVSGDSSVRFQ